MEDFGIIIGCCDQDYLFAQGTCASIRHFMGDVPICLLVDGISAPAVRAMEKTYNVQVINHVRVADPFLKKNSFSWGLTKMISFWESPWPNYLFLDADTIVWGDVYQQFADFKDYDFVVDLPESVYTDADVSYWFFDVNAIEKHFPDFDWRKYRERYFCTGTFFTKRNIFSLEEYKQMLAFMKKNPGIFKFGEMGLLNFMIFRGVQQGKLRVASKDMQWLMPDFPIAEEEKRFPFSENQPSLEGNKPNVIHWCGPKPVSLRNDVYVEPMTFCRKKFMKDAWDYTGWGANAAMASEDLIRYVYFYKNKIRKKVRQFKAKFN
jgi:hypothetical protein